MRTAEVLLHPDTHAWRGYAGFVAWPTIALAIVTLVLWASNIAGHALGLIPTAVALPLGTVLVYVSFTPLHEAVHGNVGGSPRKAWMDVLVGWLAGIPLLGPMPTFKAIHLRHHAKTNDPVHDPDMFIQGTGWSLVRGALGMWGHYEVVYLTRLQETSELARSSRAAAATSLLVITGVLAAATWAGLGWTVLFAVVMPAWLGVALLALLFDWLPHWPHGSRTRFLDTRAIPDRWLDVPLLAQNLHLVHHLWPRVPFYRYRALFREVRPMLEREGSPIESALDVARRVRRGA